MAMKFPVSKTITPIPESEKPLPPPGSDVWGRPDQQAEAARERELEDHAASLQHGSLAELWESETDGEVPEKLPEPPISIFNEQIQLVINSVSKTKSIPLEMSLVIVIALVSACIGRSRGVSPRKDWKEHAHLFIMLIAETGSGKSHAFKYVFGPLLKAEAARKALYKQECRQYLEDLNAYRKSKDPNKKMPVKPVNIQYLLDDSTLEAASERMEDNPKGMFWAIDEMSGFLKSLDKYNKSGNDGVRRLLSAFNAETWNTSRKSQDGLSQERYIAKGSMGIFGGIQPHLVTQMFSVADIRQGVPQRFIYVRAVVTEPIDLDAPEIPDQVDEILERVTKRLLDLQMDLDKFGDWQARYIPLDENAQVVFKHFGKFMMKETFGTEAYTYAVKLVQITLRLSLILEFLEWASQPEEASYPTVVGYDAMSKATVLAEWLATHTEAARKYFPGAKKAKRLSGNTSDAREKLIKFIVGMDETESRKLRTLDEIRDLIDDHEISKESLGTALKDLGILQDKWFKDKDGKRSRRYCFWDAKIPKISDHDLITTCDFKS